MKNFGSCVSLGRVDTACFPLCLIYSVITPITYALIYTIHRTFSSRVITSQHVGECISHIYYQNRLKNYSVAKWFKNIFKTCIPT